MNGIHEVEKVKGGLVRKLSEAKVDVEYTIKRIETDDEELKSFLFTLGCYEGEKLTVISILGENYVISVKDARYSMNLELAEAIII
ncbi:ferrous iron transport protein A [Crassaminicella profunda]|nr:ferrous iron transport protein A [Crassaminicella profunda]